MLLDNRLFVYGTLAPNQPNARILAPLAGNWQPATVIGTVHPEGWGATMGYPAIKLIGTDSVKGFLLESPDLPGFWDELDEFEGADYRRVEVTAYPENGDAVQSFIYALNDQR